MNITLIPAKCEYKNPEANFGFLKDYLSKIKKTDLVILPETTFTGYLYEKKDLEKFGEPIQGKTVNKMIELAKKHNTAFLFGIVEKYKDKFYDTAILIDNMGNIKLVYRKINEMPPYSVGKNLIKVVEIGGMKISTIICGDLFSDEVIKIVPKNLDLLIVPMSRSFDKVSPDLNRWLKEEKKAYTDRIKKIGIKTAIVNSFEINTELPAFGGAMLVDKNGKVILESPHGTDEILNTFL